MDDYTIISFLLIVYFLSRSSSFNWLPQTAHVRSLSKFAMSTKPNIILGVNKYSHDASVCLVDERSGEILFSQAKERITRRKHDGGAIGSLLKYALKYVGASMKDIALVVSNNHHYRVIPFERQVPFYSSLNYVPKDFSFDSNLMKGKIHLELSHHLAHAWSVAATSPFKSGLVLVMDGMGKYP